MDNDDFDAVYFLFANKNFRRYSRLLCSRRFVGSRRDTYEVKIKIHHEFRCLATITVGMRLPPLAALLALALLPSPGSLQAAGLGEGAAAAAAAAAASGGGGNLQEREGAGHSEGEAGGHSPQHPGGCKFC